MDRATKSSIINESSAKERIQVHLVGKINRDIYKCITEDIVTDEVIITDERIRHIENRHTGDYERYHSYIPDMISNPDYIIQDDRPFTAMVLKEFSDTGSAKHFRLALRLYTSGDEESFQNSIITFMKIRKKEYRRLVKNTGLFHEE